MDTLYEPNCSVCAAKEGDVAVKFSLNEKVKKEILKRIFEKFNVKDDIDQDLFTYTWDKLNEAVEEGAKSDGGEPEKTFLEELKSNNAVFAAFKTHRQQNDLAALLSDDAGNLRSFNDFRKASEEIIGQYNTNWLSTEYVTAVRSARTAERFNRYRKDEDLFPNLKWLPSRAINPREAHKPYYNNVRSLTDEWWKTHYPGCVWGCKCDIKNTDEAVTHKGSNPVASSDEGNETRSIGIELNPAFTGSIFTRSHPYISEAYKGAEEAVRKFISNLKNNG